MIKCVFTNGDVKDLEEGKQVEPSYVLSLMANYGFSDISVSVDKDLVATVLIKIQTNSVYMGAESGKWERDVIASFHFIEDKHFL